MKRIRLFACQMRITLFTISCVTGPLMLFLEILTGGNTGIVGMLPMETKVRHYCCLPT
jgi:hypothetical protein